MQRATQSYFKTQVTTTSQSDVLLMLYDGAITFLQQAKEHIAAKNYAQKGILISKALDIINELDATLNTEIGKDLADNLHNLYFFCSKHLVMANLKMDISMIDAVIGILNNLRSAYAQISALPEAQLAAKTAAEKLPVEQGQTRAPMSIATPAPHSPAMAAKRASNYAKNVQQPTALSPAAETVNPKSEGSEKTEDSTKTPAAQSFTPQQPSLSQSSHYKRYALS